MVLSLFDTSLYQPFPVESVSYPAFAVLFADEFTIHCKVVSQHFPLINPDFTPDVSSIIFVAAVIAFILVIFVHVVAPATLLTFCDVVADIGAISVPSSANGTPASYAAI